MLELLISGATIATAVYFKKQIHAGFIWVKEKLDARTPVSVKIKRKIEELSKRELVFAKMYGKLHKAKHEFTLNTLKTNPSVLECKHKSTHSESIWREIESVRETQWGAILFDGRCDTRDYNFRFKEDSKITHKMDKRIEQLKEARDKIRGLITRLEIELANAQVLEELGKTLDIDLNFDSIEAELAGLEAELEFKEGE
jgi:hypothetical protein